jgi:hypothetical protein
VQVQGHYTGDGQRQAEREQPEPDVVAGAVQDDFLVALLGAAQHCEHGEGDPAGAAGDCGCGERAKGGR